MDRHLDYLNYNSTINYPLHENVIPSDIPKDFFVDVSILVPENVTLPIFIASIYLTGGTVAVTVKDSDFNVIGAATSQIDSGSDYFTASISPVYFDTVSGIITFGPGVKRMASDYLTGRYDLDRSQGELETSCLTFTTTRFVKALLVNDEYFYGDVKLEAGDNVKLEYDESNNIVISAVDPEQFLPECYVKNDCYPELCKGILQINDVFPDGVGNIVLEGDGITLFSSSGTKIILDTPQITPFDICNNYTQGPPGDPGDPGTSGPTGPSGTTICPEDDCLNWYPSSDPNCTKFI